MYNRLNTAIATNFIKHNHIDTKDSIGSPVRIM